ncbi:MAG TPA: glycine cleavage T C-terminal barrel domain-containing protein, partial [Candidatus Acidoferrales bacterium]|nr:glycine cleavage T C-terminal barrel domain-containing protein [Candidatus Acidoferrales bacterium]
MNQLMLREFHAGLGARLTELNGSQAVNDYGDWLAEHAALRQSAGVLDLSFRSRLCLVGADRARFLHGQVTNDVSRLRVGQGSYAAITNAKGKMEGDVNILCLADELLLDFEPGLAGRIAQRLEKFIVADDVQIVDAAPHYGLLSVQGPQANAVVAALGLFSEIPRHPLASVRSSEATLGEIYLANNARLSPADGRQVPEARPESPRNDPSAVVAGFDVFVPNHSLEAVADKLIAAARSVRGRACGWQALETARIEAGIPRYGADMDETNLPLECGLEARAITYTKGCYVGQEVINRVHSVGHVNRELCGLRLEGNPEFLPQRGDKLIHAGKEAGYVTSAVRSPLLNATIALGYVRRGVKEIGAELTLKAAKEEISVQVVA